MGVFKEHAIAFETVESKQKQIYSDAADFGFPYNTENVPEEIQTLIHYVNDLKNTSLASNRTKWGNPQNNRFPTYGVSLTIEIGWEIDEGMECGTRYNISFCKDNPKRMDMCQNCNAFISVSSESYRKPYKNR